jgi:hypothetical protein
MNEPRSTGNALLAQTRPGLAVYDPDGQRVGTVRHVQPGAGEPDDGRDRAREAIADVRGATTTPADQPGTGDIAVVGVGGLSGDGGHPLGPLTAATPRDGDDGRGGGLQGILGAHDPDDADAVPDALARTGYLAIDGAGLFAAARYATPDQIAAVDEGGVRLAVPVDHLASAR